MIAKSERTWFLYLEKEMLVKELISILETFNSEDKIKIIIGKDWDEKFITRDIISLGEVDNVVLIRREGL